MSELFSAFGIDWHLLVINSINFGLLLAALWYFLYGPIVRMLEERRQKIAQGVEDAERAGDELREVQAARAGLLADAGKEAQKLVADARAAGSAKERELVAAGEASAHNIVKAAEMQASEMKSQAIAESKQEVAKLIVLGMERLAKK